jgi:catechol 2,3-dioxygenase-like lactoylglutathione lyase family enzyme
MKKIVAAATFVVLVTTMVVTASWSGDIPKRPRITGLAWARIRVSSPGFAQFYGNTLQLAKTNPCDRRAEICYAVNAYQTIGLVNRGGAEPRNRLEEVGFYSDDVKQLRAYLTSRGIQTGQPQVDGRFTVRDPEKHTLVFLPPPGGGIASLLALRPIATKMIHAGWVVRDREAMDEFYRDVLGFHLYWQGGMKDDRVDWVSMQVPDGTDWIEYMLNIPPDASKHLLGVMNHIALGVPSVQAAAEQLRKNGVKLTEELKIGRDGKWQLNLYDPDDTRVELMEFTPVEKPCCSEFTGTHPKP